MDPNSPIDRAAYTAETGFAMIAVGDDYIPLGTDLQTLVNDRLSGVPWIPRGVVGKIDDWIGRQVSGIYWIAVPVSSPVNRPVWLDSPEKIAWWDALAKTVQKARLAYGAKQLAVGRAAMHRATNDIAFWDRAIAIARTIAMPVTLIEQGAAQFMSSTTFKLLMVVGVGFAVYKLILTQSQRPHRKMG